MAYLLRFIRIVQIQLMSIDVYVYKTLILVEYHFNSNKNIGIDFTIGKKWVEFRKMDEISHLLEGFIGRLLSHSTCLLPAWIEPELLAES